MDNKGFTLIELLGVITLVVLITLIVLPNVVNTVRNSSIKVDDTTKELIYDASKMYVSNHIDNFPNIKNNKYVIRIDELINDSLLSSPVKLSNNKEIGDSLCVQVNYNGDYLYELKENCDVVFISKPNLFNGLLTPVIYDGTNWKVADKDSEWYDYYNQEWANAVILKNNKNVGDTVNVDGFNSDIYAMYVWIPRYEYKISDAASSTPREISINFISSNTTTPSEGYQINSGFTFGSTNLSGIWVGKFETSNTTSPTGALNCKNEFCTNADNIRIVPNVQSLRNNNVSNFFFISRSMGRSENIFGINNQVTDSHMMKNSEWGIVAYLSHSRYGKYGNNNYTGANKEIYINNSSGFVTGRSGGAPGGSTPINGTYTDQTSTTQYVSYGFYTYDDYLLDYSTNDKGSKVANKGTGASTTGNIYGIYDMSGGAWDYVMGAFADSSNNLWSGGSATSNSGFTGKVGASGDPYTGVTFPNSKYYDVYKASNGTTMTQNQACNGEICYGHAVNPEVQRWYSDYSSFVSATGPWFMHGGYYINGTTAGIFYRGDSAGYANTYYSFRLVLTES